MVVDPRTCDLEIVPLKDLLGDSSAWRIARLSLLAIFALGSMHVVVLQRVGEIVSVREKEVFGHVHELEQSHVSTLSDLGIRLTQFFIQLSPQ